LRWPILEPAYDVAGDSFDYAINDNIVHLTVIDAMGHGLNAAILATLAISVYRHARRAGVGLAELHGLIDAAVDQQFGPDQFVTAQMVRLDIATGRLQWVNAGHPAPLLIRGHRSSGRCRAWEPFRSASAVPHRTSARNNSAAGATTDDATLFLMEWQGGSADHLAAPAL
jgi:hypothetical protein